MDATRHAMSLSLGRLGLSLEPEAFVFTVSEPCVWPQF